MKKSSSTLARTLALCSIISGAMFFSLTGCTQTAHADQTQTTAAQTSESKDSEKPEDFLKQLVEDGKLSQETCDKIEAWMKENMPESKDKKAPADDSKKPADGNTDRGGNDGNTSETRPEKPDKAAGKAPDDGKGHGDGNMQDGHMEVSMPIAMNLDKLLSEGIITQDEYEAIKAALPDLPTPPEKPADDSSAA